MKTPKFRVGQQVHVKQKKIGRHGDDITPNMRLMIMEVGKTIFDDEQFVYYVTLNENVGHIALDEDEIELCN